MTAPAALFGDNLTASLIADLGARGWAFAPGALDPELTAMLRSEAAALDAAGDTRAARIGRRSDETRRESVRRTRIAWLDGESPAQSRLMAGAEALRRDINRALFLGLFEFEAHFSIYPPGGFYARHLDAFAPKPGAGANAALGASAARSRIVSMVVFLNEAWSEAHGGRLVLWDSAPEGPDARPDLEALGAIAPAAEIAPKGGGIVLMLSEAIPHEVRPTLAVRYAIAGWFRVNASVGGVADPLG